MKKFVFVIMPFRHEFDDIYQLGIKSACMEEGCYCERVDEQIYDGNMIERIYNQIRCADIIVADVSEKNPNVFFEVGYAFALEKKVILITQSIEDIPFDMKNYLHVEYKRDGIFKLKQDLQRRIESMKNQKKDYFSITPEIFINGVKLKEDMEEYVRIEMEPKKGFLENFEGRVITSYVGEISLALYNPSEIYKIKSLGKFSELNLQLVLDRDMPFDFNRSNNFFISEDKRCQKMLFEPISPNYWDGKNFPIEIDIKKIDKIKKVYDCQLMLFLDRKIQFDFKCSFIIKK